MPQIYRVRADLDEAAIMIESMQNNESGCWDTLPLQLGLPVEIPKCLKGEKCERILKMLQCPGGESERVWAETKYDGERYVLVSLQETMGPIKAFGFVGCKSMFNFRETNRIVVSPFFQRVKETRLLIVFPPTRMCTVQNTLRCANLPVVDRNKHNQSSAWTSSDRP